MLRSQRWGADRCGFGRSHANLTVVAADEARIELDRSLRWIRLRYGDKAVPVVSYPYGLSSPDVERRARGADPPVADRRLASPSDGSLEWAKRT